MGNLGSARYARLELADAPNPQELHLLLRNMADEARSARQESWRYARDARYTGLPRDSGAAKREVACISHFTFNAVARYIS